MLPCARVTVLVVCTNEELRVSREIARVLAAAPAARVRTARPYSTSCRKLRNLSLCSASVVAMGE